MNVIKYIDRLQLIIKLSERCNLSCTYCYYFNGHDDSYKERPALISIVNIEKIVNFLNRSLKEVNVGEIDFTFHGGEPLLFPKRKFIQMIDTIELALPVNVKKNFIVQTSATLIDAEWIELFVKKSIRVGISIDGPKIYNDMYRIDHNGKGSYDSIVKGINFINSINDPKFFSGSISVINCKFDYEKITSHLHNDLGIKRLSFLLPDTNYDDKLPNNTTIDDYKLAFSGIFKVWVQSKELAVRQIDNVLNFFQERTNAEYSYSDYDSGSIVSNQILVIQSDSTITIDDSFMPTNDWRKLAPSEKASKTSLKQFLSHEIFNEINTAYKIKPEKCTDCVWYKLCRGGDLENRYSSVNGFDNPSIFCEALSHFYGLICKHLVSSGYPLKNIINKLEC